MSKQHEFLVVANQLEAQWVPLMLAGNHSGLAPYLADDFLLVSQHGAFINKVEFLSAMEQKKMSFEYIAVDNQQFRFYPDAFLAVCCWQMKMRFYGRHFDGRTVISALWSQRSGNWQMEYIQSTDSTILKQWQDLTAKPI